ncbi:MAG: UDP-N-acetylmuramate--L-alanine ligase [Bifidobacteriaceae bacterium]|jgi:UDP-N-acetylmuramate--alanine ligase|nr:UDP-N-acetylmuramate--L-alanine ligase [Bifidobacteriaceae bacterium]
MSGSAQWPEGRIHLIGVGGVGMSAIAELMAADGLTVSGSDRADSPVLARLRRAGVEAWAGHAAAHVDGAALVVVSSAIRETNPELARARALGIPVIHRSVALARLAASRRLLAVAGTHGKTTTSAMLATALTEAGLDPSAAIGGVVLGAGTGSRAGSGPLMVIEADESDGSFLNYAPDVAVITNIEPDHLDHYGTREAVERAFHDFADRIRPGGRLIACADDPAAASLARAVRAARPGLGVVTYGADPAADVRVEGVPGPEPAAPAAGVNADGSQEAPSAAKTLDARGEGAGWHRVSLRGRGLDQVIEVAQPGWHVALDAAAAYLAAVFGAGADPAAVAEGLAAFRGTGRRFEPRGAAAGVRVFDDYAHHPTEIRATLGAAREVAGAGRVLVVFQPHLYSRTKNFAAGFAAALAGADHVWVLDVFAAREDPVPGVDGSLITALMDPAVARFEPDRAAAVRAVAAAARPGDIILTVGAGDVTALGPEILQALEHGPAAAREAAR